MTDFCVEFINGWIIPTEPTEKGGAGSGFFARDGHVGIVGHQGGSAHEGSGISSQSSTFDVRTVSPDDMVIMHSPFTDEDTVVNFRGLNGDKAAVFNMKSGIQSMIPKEWITGKAESGISSQSGENTLTAEEEAEFEQDGINYNDAKRKVSEVRHINTLLFQKEPLTPKQVRDVVETAGKKAEQQETIHYLEMYKKYNRENIPPAEDRNANRIISAIKAEQEAFKKQNEKYSSDSGISSQSGGLPKSTNYKLVDRKTGRIVAEGNRNDMDKLIKKYPKSDVYNLPRSRVGELMQDAPPRVVTPMGARRANYGIWGD